MEPLETKNKAEQLLCARAEALKIPINGILELTPLCNMNCDMCYVRLSREEMDRKGKLLSGVQWLGIGQKMAQAGTLFVLLTGGEPLLHPDFKEIYLGLRKLGMIITINTNGTLINEEWASFFAQYKPRRINITLYGPDEHAYDTLCHHRAGFRQVIKAIELLKSNGIDIKLNGSITPANAHGVDQMLHIAESMDLYCKFDTYMYPATRERDGCYNAQARLSPEAAAAVKYKIMCHNLQPEEIRITAGELRNKLNSSKPGDCRLGCRAGTSSFMINWQGNMRPCIMVDHPSVSVYEAGFQDAWKAIVEETSLIRTSKVCACCEYRNVCQVCGACALLETGSYDGVPEYMCRYTKETVRLLSESLEENP